MYDPKDKALGGIQMILEKRMTGRLAPKKKPEEESQAPEDMIPPTDDESKEDESLEGPEGSTQEEKTEDPLEEKIEQAGGDIDKLSPEEKNQLKMLYEKMGC